MSRPMSAPRVKLRPTSAHRDNTNDENDTYEDLLVAKYLNELRLSSHGKQTM